METVIYPMRVMKLLGIEMVIITNAAGGLTSGKVGDVVVLQGQLPLFWTSPAYPNSPAPYRAQITSPSLR
jgi:purine-nucleoside phosphorylase